MSTSTNRPRAFAAPVLLALTLLAGCGGGSSTSAPATLADAVQAARSHLDWQSRSPDGLDRCALLKDEEIDAAIGAHRPGGLGDTWGGQSCRWESTTDQHVSGAENGWFESIEIAVFFKDEESSARERAEGYPVQGFVPGALYNPTYGHLWFDCGAYRFCAVKARTTRTQRRDQIARQVAQLIVTRLH